MRSLYRLFTLSRVIVPIVVAALLATATFAISAPEAPQAATPPAAPAGLTAIALDGSVGLAWQPSVGATSYTVYRGTTAASITQQVSPANLATSSYTDTTAVNGTTYYYAVKASSDGGQSTSAQVTQATPRARSCSTGNAVVIENCFPGTTAWKAPEGTRSYSHGIDGFVSASSINAGGSVQVRAQVDWDAPWHIEIYRTGWYGGAQGRLVGVIPGLSGEWQPDCANDSSTGRNDCSNWDPQATLSTTDDWVSGVYTLKFVRDDNGTYSETILVVRKDGSHSDILHGVPTSTYQAYNRYNGKSLYSGQSNPPATLTGTNRAVKADFDRPYSQPNSDDTAHDWYGRTDVGIVSWIERQGYDTTYIASEDLHTDGAQLTNHKVFITGAHDEYWSQPMRDAVTAARDAGTSIFVPGANTGYWRVRFEAGVSGVPNRVMVGYKTIESGPADPVSLTSTFRDPTINKPENALLGAMYVGENLTKDFPLFVSADQGANRIWRYTALNSMAAGTTASIGTGLVGWEWDARVSNGLQPAGVGVIASTPVNGQLIGGNGAFQNPGSITQESTLYKAASGAVVFDTGTINWWRGLANNVHGSGEPDSRIQQATMNVLADMGAHPTTPAGTMMVDAPGAPAVASTTPANGATAVQPNAAVKITFDRELDPSTVGPADFSIHSAGGDTIPVVDATVDSTRRVVTVVPDDAFDPFTSYTVSVGTGMKSWLGTPPAGPSSFSFTTGQGTPPVVVQLTPTASGTNAPTDVVVKARFDRQMDPATITASSFSIQATGGSSPVPATVSYDAATRTARLTPNARLAQATGYSVLVTSSVKAVDGVAMTDPVTWTFTTGSNLQINSRTPAPLASGLSPQTNVRVVFSRGVDPSTLTASSFSLTGPGGTAVPASITYDAATFTATLNPTDPLSLMATYTGAISTTVHAADGGAVDASTWTFTTATVAPPAPAVSSLSPTSGQVGVSDSATVRAEFTQPLDPATVNSSTFTLTPVGGTPVAATVTYDPTTQTALLRPVATMNVAAQYTAAITTGIRSTTGAPLAASQSWTFTTANCPCSLMGSGLTPQSNALPVQDYRPGSGPFTYELGTKIVATSAADLTSLRFYKATGETGTHVGRVWNTSGTQLASVTFQNESASGWQRQSLATPLSLTPGQTYIVSVGVNAFYAKTQGGLATQLTSGPLQSLADGLNGVYANTSGTFPSLAYASSNYFVDAVVRVPSEPRYGPQVQSVTPLSGATGVSVNSTVRVTFARPIDSSTLSSSTFKLIDSGGTAVAASVAYDDSSQTAILTPAAALSVGAAYTAAITTGLKSEDGLSLASQYTWSFTTVPPAPPTVTQTSPDDGAVKITSTTAVTATFSQAMTASTINGSTVTLTAPGGGAISATVSYNAAARVATLQPIAPLQPSTLYTARVTTGAQSSQGVGLSADMSWTFTTSACPCTLFGTGNPVNRDGNLDVANGRSGAPPYSLELGVKIKVDSPASLTAVRFYKDANESGTHVGRVWNAAGTQLTSVTFTGETAGAGWQQMALATPLALVPGQTYVVSVNANARFGMTSGAFWSELVNGPLHSIADGQNGLYGNAGGAFPTSYWGASNYWIDAEVK